MNMTKSKLCSQCSAPIKAHRKYCSQKCYNDYRESQKVYKECAECGKLITRPPTHFTRIDKAFCSRACTQAHMVKENHHAHQPELHGNCPTCGKYLERTDTTYCSEACVPRTGEDNPKYLERYNVPCTHCGSILLRTAPQIGENNYCSIDCKNKHYGTLNRGENNPRYKDGVWQDYGRVKKNYEGFTLKIRKAIRKRDGNICQVCETTKEEHGMNMHVHHIDYNKQNNHQDNLVCVCRYCHGKIHGDEELWQEILLEKLSLSTE